MITFRTKVVKVEEKRRVVRGWKDAKGDDQFEYENLGWFVLLDGLWDAIHVGDRKPDVVVGDTIVVIMRKMGS